MFKVRDLLIVCALIVGVTCGVYRTEIAAKAREIGAPAFWYLDAPARESAMQEAHKADAARLEAMIEEKGRWLWDVHSQKLEVETSLHAVRVELAAANDRVSALEGDLAALRYKYSALCQRLLELGNDVPSVLTVEK